MPEPSWFDVAGGKLTTYRHIAEQVTGRVVSYLGKQVGIAATATEPLLPVGPDPAPSGVLPPAVSAEVVEHYCRREWAVHLDDVMIRRTSWHYYHADAASIAVQVADWMAAVHGWNRVTKLEEQVRYLKLLVK